MLRVRRVRPLGDPPRHGAGWAAANKPDRLPATYHRTHGVRYFHGCYSVGDDPLWGVIRRRKGADTPWPRSSRSARPARRRPDLRHPGQPVRAQDRRHPRLGGANKVELCFTPTNASWANPIEAHFGPLRKFTIAGSHHPNHTVLTRRLHAYLRWRNANARHPDVLAAQRRERARIRSERQQRWGRPKLKAA